MPISRNNTVRRINNDAKKRIVECHKLGNKLLKAIARAGKVRKRYVVATLAKRMKCNQSKLRRAIQFASAFSSADLKRQPC